MEALPIHGWAYTAAFHQAYVDLAARYKVPLVPFILMNVIGNPRLMQPDRAHPNADGARAIADVIWPYLERDARPSRCSPIARREPQPVTQSSDASRAC